MNNNVNIDDLLKEKEYLKTQIKFSKKEIKAQKKMIEIQKARAEKGQKNTLAFEQRELPKRELNLVSLKERLIDVKNTISKYKIVSVENQYLLDTKFIDQLRLNWSNKYFVFENIDNIEIVPDKLTHSYLLNNFNISQSISNYYHSNSKGLMSDVEYQKKVKGGYKGAKEEFLIPYSININGGFYSVSDLHCKLTGAIYLDKCIKGKKIKYLSDLTPYFKDYNLGFKKGFDNFEIDCIKPYLMEFSDKKDFINKVFEYLTKEITFKHTWNNGTQGFTTNGLNKNRDIIRGIDDGKKQGYFYRAWTIVFSNSNLFEPLFDTIKKKPQQKNKKTSTKKKKYLIDLFETTELYNKVINILIEKEFISKNGNTLKWIKPKTKKHSVNQTIIALMVVLEKKHYLKPKPSAVYYNIENDFNIKIDKGTYSVSSNGFKEDYNTELPTTNKSYIDLFKDIL